LEWVDETIKRLDPVSEYDFEIVIVSEPTSGEYVDTLERRESTVRYFENVNQLGYPGSILKLVDEANGDFVLFSSDEDYIIPEKIPEILQLIEENGDVSRIFTGANREAEFGIYEPEEALRRFWFKQRHLTGCLLQRNALDTTYCSRYADESENPLGPYITQILAAQAMKVGKTMYADLDCWGRGEKQITEHDVDYSSYENRARQCAQRVTEVLPDLIEEPELATYLLNEERKRAGLILLRALKDSPRSTVAVLRVFGDTGDLLSSRRFWMSLPVYVTEYLIYGGTRRQNVW
jgi:glycosyltransferase involved in cell wall biosynthesis